LDVLTEHIQELAPRCMLFVDDVVSLGESREEVNGRLETWRQALELYGFRLSRCKTEYMECNFSGKRSRSTLEVKVGDHIISQVTRFKYLGSLVQNDGEEPQEFCAIRKYHLIERKVLPDSSQTGVVVWYRVLGG